MKNFFGKFPEDDLLYFYAGGSYGATYLGGMWMYDPDDETTPRMIGKTVSGDGLMRWNDRWYFKSMVELEPDVWTNYYGLCSSDAISPWVMHAYFSTNFSDSQQIFLDDSTSY